MRLSIGARILLSIVLIQLVSAALIIGWFFYAVQSELDALTRRNAQDAVLRAIETTEAYFAPAETATQEARRLIAGDVVGRDRPERLERYLFEQLRLRPQLAGLYVGYPDGGFHYVMRSDEGARGGTRTKVIEETAQGRAVTLTWRGPDFTQVKAAADPDDPYDPRTRSWYDAALDAPDGAWTEPYIFFTARRPGITAATAVPGEDGAVRAVVGADIEMSAISGFLAQSGLGLGGTAFLVTPDGKVIAHSGIDVILPDPERGDDALRFATVGELPGLAGALGDEILARATDTVVGAPAVWPAALDGRDHVVAIGRMDRVDWPWHVAVIMPMAGLAEVARTSHWLLAGIVLLATALACAIGFALARSIGRPLAALHGNAQLARNANYELMEEITSGYREIDETDAALHALAERQRGHR